MARLHRSERLADDLPPAARRVCLCRDARRREGARNAARWPVRDTLPRHRPRRAARYRGQYRAVCAWQRAVPSCDLPLRLCGRAVEGGGARAAGDGRTVPRRARRHGGQRRLRADERVVCAVRARAVSGRSGQRRVGVRQPAFQPCRGARGRRNAFDRGTRKRSGYAVHPVGHLERTAARAGLDRPTPTCARWATGVPHGTSAEPALRRCRSPTVRHRSSSARRPHPLEVRYYRRAIAGPPVGRTRHTRPPASSATSSVPSAIVATPTGRP